MNRVTYCCEYCNYAIPGLAELIAERDKLKAELVNREGEKQEMREVIDRLKAEAERAQLLVAKMHAAAVGEIRGPTRGVVEDIEDLRADLEREREANAKLKTELTEAQGYIEGQDKEIIRLQTELRLVRKDRDQTREISQRRGLELASQRAENAKLREALIHIYEPAQNRECCMRAMKEDELDNHMVEIAFNATHDEPLLAAKQDEGN